MLTQQAQVAIIVMFSLVGILAGVLQSMAERTCPCCSLSVSRSASRCPHCRCHLG